MKKKAIVGAIALACALVLALAGCMPGGQSEEEKKHAENRAFMSQVNETMSQLRDSLDQFIDAVSRDDVVGMRVQADNAYKVLDSLSDIKAPDEMSSVKDSYVNGANKMKEALDAYIALYTEMSAGDDSFDMSTYQTRIEKVQSLYDEGVKALEAADAEAADKAAGNSSSSSSASA